MAITLPHDIIEPAPIGWWPLAPGWWLLAALLLLALTALAGWQWRRWRQLAPLRQALREHRGIAAQWQQQHDSRRTTAALSALLKRTARWRYPATDIAALTGERWQQFLIQTGNGAFDADNSAALCRFYQAPTQETFEPPLTACLHWLQAQTKPRRHV